MNPDQKIEPPLGSIPGDPGYPIWKQRERLDWLEAQQRQAGATRLLQWTLAIAIAVLVAAVLVGTARGEVPAQLIPGKFAPAWMIYRPAGFQDGNILQDVTSRCTPQQRQTAYEADRVTYCHESTHQLHSRIRNAFPGGTGKVNAVYCGAGRCLILREPRIRLSHVRQYVTQHRNSTYQLYLVSQGAHWENEPLYVLDEWVSYANGTQCARELKIDAHGSDTFMNYFCHYADALVEAVKRHDPQYADLDKLTTFVTWHKQRCKELSQ